MCYCEFTSNKIEALKIQVDQAYICGKFAKKQYFLSIFLEKKRLLCFEIKSVLFIYFLDYNIIAFVSEINIM